MPNKREIQDIINSVIISRDDIAFTHSVFVQCFLPIRSLEKGRDFYEVSHGDVSLAIEAGRLIDPNNYRNWEKREVPSGAKARLLFAYINDRAIRTKSRFIDMGSSLRNFMERNGVPIGGKNGKAIVEQTKNIAAAEIMLGEWSETKVSQCQTKVARGLSFWLEKDSKQGTLWQPEMELSKDYMETLQGRKVPLDFRALVGLQASPRAMDAYCWLAYRLRSIKVPVKIPYEALHPIFGQGIKQLKHFKEEFRKAVMEAHKFYPEARIELDKDYVTLGKSPPSVPADCPKAKLLN